MDILGYVMILEIYLLFTINAKDPPFHLMCTLYL